MSKTFIIEVKTKYKYTPFVESFFEGIATTISCFEAEVSAKIDPEPEDIWRVEVYLESLPNFSQIQDRFMAYAQELGLEIIFISHRTIENIDFAQKVLEDFKPIKVGSFYIHNTAHKTDLPKNLITMEISSGLAFGTGDHETTSGCLEFISGLAEHPKKILDMGTGSGVLSIAAAKLFNCSITAIDIEQNSIITAKENFRINNVEKNIELFLADGYEDKIYANGPYDLILSNILARPLIAMAPDLSKNLKTGGVAILAGFLEDQAEQVIEAHTKHDMDLISSNCKNNWVISKLIKRRV
jgi:ribosomal protein L11 methyltransferase